jgi:hypothetical protein
MDRRVMLVEFVKTKSAINAVERAEQDVKEVWASVKFKSSSEDFEEKVYSINKRAYIIHYDPTITAKLVQDLAVKDEYKTYYVTGVDAEYGGRKKYIYLECEYRG